MTGMPSQLRVCVQRSTRTERAPRAGRQATSGGRKDALPTGSRALPLSHRGARGEHPLPPRHAPSLPRWNFPGKLSPPETPGSRRRFPWKSGGVARAGYPGRVRTRPVSGSCAGRATHVSLSLPGRRRLCLRGSATSPSALPFSPEDAGNMQVSGSSERIVLGLHHEHL